MDENKAVCIGSACRDIFFPLEEAKVLNTPEDLTAQRHLLLELGAKYRTENRYEAPGGCSLNVSTALSRLGVCCASYSILGDDLYGDGLVEDLVEEGVDTRYIVRERGVKTDVSCILVETRSADRVIVYNRDANERLQIRKEDIESFSEIFVSGMYGDWRENLFTVREIVRENAARLYYNPGQKNISDDAALIADIIGVSEIVFLNKDEAIEMALKSVPDVSRDHILQEKYLLESIWKLGAKQVVVTDGSRGAWAYDGETLCYAKGEAIAHVADSTGAGDAFTGAFLAAYLKQKDIAECLRWGIANGGNAVQYYGARDGLLKKEEIASRSKSVTVTQL